MSKVVSGNEYPELDGMESYIGTKISGAKPMNRQEYNDFRGWNLPSDEDGSDDGYIVQYTDGYVSWSPASQFEEAYRKTTGMNFGLAVEAMKKGLKVCREGWNGKGMFAYYVPANSYAPQTEAIKTVFTESVPYRHYLALRTAQGDVATWSPSTSDALADDWQVVE